MRLNVVTLFPDFFRGPLGLSIPARAAAAELDRRVPAEVELEDRHGGRPRTSGRAHGVAARAGLAVLPDAAVQVSLVEPGHLGERDGVEDGEASRSQLHHRLHRHLVQLPCQCRLLSLLLCGHFPETPR